MSRRLLRVSAAIAGLSLALAGALAIAANGRVAGRPAPAHFSGGVAVFGRIPTPGASIRAYVGATLCGTGTLKGTYAMNVLSDQDRPGCGTDNADVKIAIGDYWANETGQWQAGAFQDLDLSAPRLNSTDLQPGCTDGIKVTLSNNTTIADLVSLVQPAENLQAIWKHAAKDWQSWFPDGQDADNTLKTVSKGDTITVCVSDASSLSMPIPAPPPPASPTPSSP